jgi:hypothetical protein
VVPWRHESLLIGSSCPLVASAGGTPKGATGAEVVETCHRLGDCTGNRLQDFVVYGAAAGISGSVAPSDVALGPRSSSPPIN